MNFSVHAILVSRDDTTSFWVGEYGRGVSKGLIGLPGGKSGYPEQVINALRRELQEETMLPAEAFDMPLIRPVETRNKSTKAYCFFVWFKPSFTPFDNDEITNWRRITAAEARADPRVLDFAKDHLIAWLKRKDCPLTRSAGPTSPSS